MKESLPTHGKRPLSSSSPISSPPNKIRKLVTNLFSPPKSQLREEMIGNRACWHATWKRPSPSTKIAAFDIDGTIIVHKKDPLKPNKRYPQNDKDWMWLNQKVLPSLRRAHDEGYTIVFFSNQAGLEKTQRSFRLKIPLLAKNGLNDIPFHVFAALDYSIYRKPATGMWDYFASQCNEGIEIDMKRSYYVGDAAGRFAGQQVRFSDFSDIDRKFAHNIDLPFYTPEEFFLSCPTSTSWSFRTHNWPSLTYNYSGPLFTPCSSPLVPYKSDGPEVVIFIGPPGSGKTRFFERYFQGAEYVDLPSTLSYSAQLSFISSTLECSKSLAITSLLLPSRSSRSNYINPIKTNHPKTKIRLFEFTTGWELSRHNVVYRTLYRSVLIGLNSSRIGAREEGDQESVKGKVGRTDVVEDRRMVARDVWESWKRREESCDPSSEGVKVVKIHFRFEGTEAEEKLWRRCLDIWKREPVVLGKKK